MTFTQIDNSSDFSAFFDVSRETIERLEEFHSLLGKWNKVINLVSRASFEQSWHRHFADSAQLWDLREKEAQNWLDIGSGGGFPGLVLAILALETAPALKFTFIESDQRKCAFLLNVCHALSLNVSVLSQRIEKTDPQVFDMISARALASIDELLNIVEKFTGENTVCLFPKGSICDSELTEARKIWHIETQEIPSMTDRNAVILRIESFSRV